MELDLETGMRVLDLLEDAKEKILDHVLDTVFPSARLDVLGASIAAFDEALAEASPDNPFIVRRYAGRRASEVRTWCRLPAGERHMPRSSRQWRI